MLGKLLGKFAKPHKKREYTMYNPLISSGSCRARTSDPLIMSQML